MAYTGICGYTNDVFISYAHADNEPLMGSVKWVDNFVEDLQISLTKRLDKNEGIPKIWIDHELAKNIELDNALASQLKNAATYLLIISPAYLNSIWCKKERQIFMDLLNKKRATTRVFLVEIDEVERSRFPLEFDQNLVSYKFWKKDIDSKPRTIGIPERKTEEYYMPLLDIATDLAKELQKIRKLDKAFNVDDSPSKETVFIAQTTDDLDEKREDIKRCLKEEGYKVIPEENGFQNYEPIILQAKINEYLNNCSLYIQLLSGLEGKKIAGLDESIVTWQNDNASRSGKKIMVWKSPEVDNAKVRSPKLIELLNSQYVRSEDFEEFKSAVKKTLLPAPAPVAIDTHSDNPRFVYICTDAKDRQYSENVLKKEIKQAGLGYSLPILSRKMSVVKQYQKQNFIDCYATLFVYCETEPEAVLSQIMECYKAKAQRKQPFRAVAIFDGPPKDGNEGMIDIELPFFEISTLNCRQDIKEFSEKFLKRLQND